MTNVLAPWTRVAAASLAVGLTLLAPAPVRAGTCDPCCKDMQDGSSCNNRQAKTACGDGAQGPGCQNGCGPGGVFDGLIHSLNSATGADFTYACNFHDNCYNNCNRGRDFCDEQLLGRMQQACEQAWSGQLQFLVKAWCQAVASHNYLFVRGDLAGLAYKADQQANCKCCDGCTASPAVVNFSSDVQNCDTCGNSCSANETCVDGQCTCQTPCMENGVPTCCKDGESCCSYVNGTQGCRAPIPNAQCGVCQFQCGDIPCCDYATGNSCCRRADYSYSCNAGPSGCL